jgi:hypothetical protein
LFSRLDISAGGFFENAFGAALPLEGGIVGYTNGAMLGRTFENNLNLTWGHFPAELVEKVQQDGDTVGGSHLRPAWIQNHRETFPVGRRVVRVITAQRRQVLPGPNLGFSGGKGIAFGGAVGHHDEPIRRKEKKLASIARPEGV